LPGGFALPGCAVHTLLGTQVLARWADGTGAAPFPFDKSDCLAAFHAGCMGPDFGYYPGGDQTFAALAHYLCAADLARTLIRTAPECRALAFAWGWATHVLADAVVHPVINREAARRSGLGVGESLTYADAPATHVRVEMGVDAFYSREMDVPQRAVAWLATAYDVTYQIRIDRNRLLATQRRALRLMPRLLAFERLICLGLRDDPPRPGLAGWLLGAAGWLVPRRSTVYGLLRPEPPPAALVGELGVLFAAFADRFLAHAATGLTDLPEYNLDTGGVEGEDPEYPLSRSAQLTVERLRANRRT
jgi:hypothetical protein